MQQNTMRTLAEAGKDDEYIQNYMNSWKPGQRISIDKDPKAALQKYLSTLSKEEKAAWLQAAMADS